MRLPSSDPNGSTASAIRAAPPDAGDGTALRYVWIALAGVAVWLLFYHDPAGQAVPNGRLWALFGGVTAVEAVRAVLVRRAPSHPVHRVFPFFDALAISVAVRLTHGIESELWLLYAFQLVAGALDPEPRTLRVLGALVVLSYAAAVLPDLTARDWSLFLAHLHFPIFSSGATFPPESGVPGYEVLSKLLTRLFFLFVVGRMAQAVARMRAMQQRELAALREQLAVAGDRSRIARDLHDSLNHTLMGSVLRLELCSRLLRQDPDETARMLDEEKAALREALDAARDTVFHLLPAELEDRSLTELLRRCVERYRERTGLTITLEGEEAPEVRPALRVAGVAIVQEALANAVKHARAGRIAVTVAREGHRRLLIRVTDDGAGFTPDEAPSGGMGLTGMAERAAALGGSVTIRSAPGAGATVEAVFPL